MRQYVHEEMTVCSWVQLTVQHLLIDDRRYGREWAPLCIRGPWDAAVKFEMRPPCTYQLFIFIYFYLTLHLPIVHTCTTPLQYDKRLVVRC